MRSARCFTSGIYININSMKKRGYYEYENGIYPRKLWVHIGRDLKEVVDAEFYGCEAPNRDYGGITYDNAVRKSDNVYGILVTFKSAKDMTMNPCCHEASHVCDAIEDAIGMEHGGEASAYLIGWIASCINKARLNIGDYIEIKEKEK